MKNAYTTTFCFVQKIFLLCSLSVYCFSAIAQSTYTVTTTADAGPGSLRQAILDANSTPAKDNIYFNIGDGGVQVIRLASNLPAITEPLVLDATSQPGYSSSPLIILDGTGVPYSAESAVEDMPIGLKLASNSSGSVIKGFVIGGFRLVGIWVLQTGNHTIQANYLGLAVDGNTAFGNYYGLYLEYSNNNLIGGNTGEVRNIISGNTRGIGVDNSSYNTISGNYVGTNADATAAVGNGLGIWTITNPDYVVPGFEPHSNNNTFNGNVVSGNNGYGIIIRGSQNKVLKNFIGTNGVGSEALANGSGIIIVYGSQNIIGAVSAGNVISGNTDFGLRLEKDAVDNVIMANYIGTDGHGEKALPNSYGIFADSISKNTIGGVNPGEGNIISGNEHVGIRLIHITGCDVVGNYIGTNASGTTAIPNYTGISVLGSRLMGGNCAFSNNLVSGNTDNGVWINFSNRNQFYSNKIGTQADGESPLPNGGNGIVIDQYANDNIFGGVGKGNIIAHNGLNGIAIGSSVLGVTNPYPNYTAYYNTISGNSIFSNKNLGIDLATNGITGNDGSDSDEGVNLLQNYPELTTNATLSGSGLSVTYVVPSNPKKVAYPLKVEFFIDDGNRQGKVFLYQDTYTEADYGNRKGKKLSFYVDASKFKQGDKILGTATDANGNTSEFSAAVAVQVEGACSSPTIWYADSDGDGYGNPGVSQRACSQSTGFVIDNTDCNDSDPAVNPGATDTTVDMNCDGVVDGVAGCSGTDVLGVSDCTISDQVEWTITNPGTCEVIVRWEVRKSSEGDGEEITVGPGGTGKVYTSLSPKGPTQVTFYWNDSNGLETKSTHNASGASCSASTTLTSSSSLNLESGLPESEVLVYPNPLTAHGLWLEFGTLESTGGSVQASMFDLSGRLMAEKVFEGITVNSKHHWNLEHSGWADGMYILIIRGKGINHRVKLIK